MKKKRFLSVSGGSGTLMTIAAMFLLSGTIRVLDGVAFAESALESPAMDAEEGAASRNVLGLAGLEAAMKSLKEREEKLVVAERAVTDKARALEVAEATVAEKLRQLAKAEESLKATMALSSTAAEEDLARLTAVFENMKPKEATEIFARMAPEFAAGFLGRMRSDAAALVLSGLDPDTAYSISVLLAGRNANAPVE